MSSAVHVHRVQYAVIEARYSGTRSERFVVAYEKEKSLREFIVAPRIIASGFSSGDLAAGILDPSGARQGYLTRLLRSLETGLGTIALWLAETFSYACENKAALNPFRP